MTETCWTCKQEIRFGVRDGVKAWWHREAVDHTVVHGRPGPSVEESRAARAAWEAEHLAPSTPEEDAVDKTIIPEPEVRAWPLDPTSTARQFLITRDGGIAVAQMPGGAKLLVRPALKSGWDVTATFSRGPSLHTTHWTCLGVRDYVVARFSKVDQRAVATWITDGKGAFKFDTAWTWFARSATLESINAKDLKELFKR